ncbi:MAG: porin family protein [Rhodobacteraceae bacterium]|nr:porin family protein [Paracoccaceae bacterium]
MTGRSTFFAAAAIAALVAGAGAASAQGFGGSFYLKGFGGATWPSGEENELQFLGGGTDIDVKLDYDTGYVLGVAVGYNYTPNIGVELEYGFRQADLKGQVSGDTRSNAVMVNAIYRLDGMGADGAFQPYFGAGIGGANIDLQTEDNGSFDNYGLFAWQLIGGVGYRISPDWTLMGEARWYSVNSGSLDGADGFSLDSGFESFDLLLGAAYSF